MRPLDASQRLSNTPGYGLCKRRHSLSPLATPDVSRRMARTTSPLGIIALVTHKGRITECFIER